MQKCAKALAFLPKAQGDAASWSSLMRRILIAINADLDFAFRGMEDGGYFDVRFCLSKFFSFSFRRVRFFMFVLSTRGKSLFH